MNKTLKDSDELEWKFEQHKNRSIKNHLQEIENKILECMEIIDILLEYDDDKGEENHFNIIQMLKKYFVKK